MFLKSVEMFGFKSFPERTTIEYNNGVTVIVGPNGCGKSNLSDAIRWVFGERSSKEMRSGDKMTDVIFNGSGERAASGFAEVTLVLDNTDRSLDVDENEVAVTRRIMRSGENEYYLNKKIVRLRDIEELFMDTGFGKDGYSLLNRSKIEAIMLGKKEERRKLFEEAAGISTHRYRREEAERSLKKADDNMVRLTDIMNELEGRLGPLKTQAEKAERFIEMDAERKSLELGVLVRNIADGAANISSLLQKSSILESQKAEYELRRRRLDEQNEQLEQKRRDCGIAIDEQRRLTETLREQSSELRSQIELARFDGQHRAHSAQSLRDAIERMQQEIVSAERLCADNDAAADAKRAVCKRVEAQIVTLQVQLEQLNRDAAGTDDAYAALFAEITVLSDRCNQLKLQRAQLEAQVQQMAVRIEESDADKQARTQRLEEVREDIELSEGDLEQIQSELDRRRNITEGLNIKLNGLRSRLEEDERKLSENKVIAEQLRHKAATLEDMERQMEGYAGSVKSVLSAAQSGRLKGIRGTVAQLITVPDRYAVAIEVALGGALQNLVTETEQQAKYGIEYLKNSNGGRATFLPMTTVNGNVLREHDVKGEFLGIAAELTQYADEYRGIFASLLGRVLVCENMDSAIAAARANNQRYRIVTLDGQLINAGGSMTGGSLNKNSGTLSRRNQIRSYTERYEKLNAENAKLGEGIAARTADRTKLEADLNVQAQQIAGLSSEKLRTELTLQQARKEAEELQNALQNHGAALAQLKKGRDDGLARIAELDGSIAADTEQLAVKNERSRQLSQGRTDFAAKREQTLADIAQKRLELLENEKDISALAQHNEAIAADCELKRMQIAQTQTQIADLSRQDESGKDAIGALEQQLRQIAEEISANQSRIAQLEQQRDGSEVEMRELKEKDRALTEESQQIVADAARVLERLETAQTERDHLIYRLDEEYQMGFEQASQQAAPVENLTETTRQLNRLRDRIKSLGQVNLGATVEYAEVNERYTSMKTQYDDIVASKKELSKLIVSLSETMTEIFTQSFERINTEFKRVFEQLFGGGKAELLLEDPTNALESEITIRANPPGKRITSLEQLSTGERAFLTIAIYFAILHVKPTPFCLLDEIESNLDDVNVQRFADYMVDMSAKTQFIAISHRRGTMEVADVLYGVTMRKGSGISRLIRLEVSEVEQKLGIKL
ncbi:MAG: chromosome segregation protein SMC [Clostridia bacterium]|nr:chromosome segregation protein SMC [Clostridia bacterium]